MAIGILSQTPVLPDDIAAEQARAQFWQPGALSQQAPGALSQHVMSQPTPTMPKPTWVDYVGDVALPLLATLATGGFGAPAALAYGLSVANSRRKAAGDPLMSQQYEAAFDKSRADQVTDRYIAENPGLGAPIRAGLPAEVMTNEYFRNDPDAIETLRKRRQAGDVGRDYTDEQGVIHRRFADGTDVVIGGGMQSDVGFSRAAKAAGGQASAQAAGRISAETAPQAVEAQAGAASRIKGAESEATTAAADYVKTLNAMSGSINDQMSIVSVLDDAIDTVESGPVTGPVSKWMAILDPQLQVLRSTISSQMLSNYTVARQSGMTGQMSDKEMQFIASIGAMLTNTRDANIEILKKQRDKVLNNINMNRQSYINYQNTKGGIRPLPGEYKRTPANNRRPDPADFDNR